MQLCCACLSFASLLQQQAVKTVHVLYLISLEPLSKTKSRRNKQAASLVICSFRTSSHEAEPLSFCGRHIFCSCPPAFANCKIRQTPLLKQANESRGHRAAARHEASHHAMVIFAKSSTISLIGRLLIMRSLIILTQVSNSSCCVSLVLT